MIETNPWKNYLLNPFFFVRITLIGRMVLKLEPTGNVNNFLAFHLSQVLKIENKYF